MNTRPAQFEMIANFNNPRGAARQYRITEPTGTYVLDASSGKDPATGRHAAVRASIVTEWTGRTATDYRGRTVFVVTTKGVSSHGNSTSIRKFDTLAEAEQHVATWARRRWRVAA